MTDADSVGVSPIPQIHLAVHLIRLIVVFYIIENHNVSLYLIDDHERVQVHSSFSCERSAYGFVMFRLLDDLFYFLHNSLIEDAVFFLELLRLFCEERSKIRLILHLL